MTDDTPRTDGEVRRVLLGVLGRPHGVRGLMRVQSFTEDPAAIVAYGVLTDEAGRRFVLSIATAGDQPVVRVEGVADRDAAAKLTGTRLFVDRTKLPPPDDEDEVYQGDLLGLAVVSVAGAALGSVVAVHDHGAGAILEVGGTTGGAAMLLPFSRAVVPVVDLAGGRLVVDPPTEQVVPPSAEDAATDDAPSTLSTRLRGERAG